MGPLEQADTAYPRGFRDMGTVMSLFRAHKVATLRRDDSCRPAQPCPPAAGPPRCPALPLLWLGAVGAGPRRGGSCWPSSHADDLPRPLFFHGALSHLPAAPRTGTSSTLASLTAGPGQQPREPPGRCDSASPRRLRHSLPRPPGSGPGPAPGRARRAPFLSAPPAARGRGVVAAVAPTARSGAGSAG